MRVLVAIALSILVRAQPAGDVRMQELLEKAAAGAERFAQEFPAVTCHERVVQLKLDERGKPVEKHEETYDYLILLNAGVDDFTFEESRIRRDRQGKEPRQPLLATTGFAVMALVFHPYYQDSFRYVWSGADTRDGSAWQKVRFEHIAGRASPSVLEVSGRQYPLEWRGVAWIDPATGAVGRIEAVIQGALEDIGLQSLSATVDYAAAGQGLWLPRVAVIEARTRRQWWKNMHEFSSYRRFEVTTQQAVAEVKP